MKGEDNSIKVGAKGTIEALMTKELKRGKVVKNDAAAEKEGVEEGGQRVDATKAARGSQKGVAPPLRKTGKKEFNVAKVVDVKCAFPDKTWASPITSRLKKFAHS